VLASTSGGEVRYSGLLSRILWQRGSVAAAAAGCRLIDPIPGQPITLARPG
jgi:hypothetical protein